MTLPDPELLLQDITAQIQPLIQANTALVGIHSGGVWMLERIRANVGTEIPFGKLDAAMYRDDYAKRGLKSKNQPSWIPFDVNDKHIILIDDIFYTGRTTRAAMNELFDYGRPASITLAVLINRGGAQLPIAPQITGAQIPLEAHQAFQLSLDTSGKFHLSLEDHISKDTQDMQSNQSAPLDTPHA
ncbi:pyrimidine operon attenuation protein/uracil phosphoribosyltransferase [Methylophilaceae bacterium 11]|jgi:pyrimidine operon attenuation protein/uracil phosphoribosyltransferase|nr:pyrimidine operon attenuation protein/uracil phosphoribosyltransferase [Methylophilaceae bacterium 11]